MALQKLRVLHLHSSFDPGGKELRCVQLINAFGLGVAHRIVSAVPGAMGAIKRINPGITIEGPGDFPSLQGKPTPGRLKLLAEAMQGHDLVCTYNFGAMDAVMAHTLFAQALGLPPLVHHEDGFNQDEALKLKSARNWYRRLALGRASALVVPSQRLEGIALSAWKQPRGRVVRIANGIRTAAYARKPRPDALPRIIKREGEYWLGTIAGLRAVKNLPALVRAFAPLPEEWQLVILGEGPERDAIRDEALRLGVGHRVHLPGFVADPSKVIGLFDLFALSSHSEQFPISVVEAMAAGLAVAAPDVGDVRAMLAGENLPFVAPAGSDGALADAIARLAGDAALRAAVGAANRARACTDYDEAAMVTAYRATYASAMGRDTFP
ncbi:MAG TPA: glycosyltransferase [Novosphingobium sp.]|nr:glycosyltransferase [Novosphingobium sp.]